MFVKSSENVLLGFEDDRTNYVWWLRRDKVA
jgi:hypothetical protein